MEQVILVDELDNEIGLMEKLEAHRKGLLHRAFSVFVFNHKGQLMLQQRAISKYHSGGLWTNTCCSHPRPGEKIIDAGRRRLKEEMGFCCELKPQFNFIYKAQVGELIEHELDHVLFGFFEDKPQINREEVEDWKWMDLAAIEKDLEQNQKLYTEWFRICFEKVRTFYAEMSNS